MSRQDDILDAVESLVLATRTMPSLADVAGEVGLTKQGLLHYFPSRAALDEAVVRRAVERVDAVMERAHREGSPTEAYLGLSTPGRSDRAATAVVSAGLGRDGSALPAFVPDALARWEAMIAEELGDPVQAQIVRLVGDSLFVESLLGGAPIPADRVARLVRRLRGDDAGEAS